MKSDFLKKFLELNFAIFCVSTAGVFVRYIDLDPIILTFWRGLIAAIIVGSIAYFKKTSFKISSKKDALRLFISSIFFASHWLTYFYALQISSVAIGMLSLFTFPTITAILEPIYFKTKFNTRHILLAILVLIGLYIMAPEIDFSNNATKGIIAGVISAVFYALRNLTMKSNIKKYDSSVLMFYQFIFLVIISSPFLHVLDNSKTMNFWPYLLALGVFTTAIGHTLFVKSFKNFPVSTASILSTSQPVYGILFGFLLLNEIPNLNTIIGGAIIISTVIIESLSFKKK
jgi:drug/metabolite transporter (DMT)-like permease